MKPDCKFSAITLYFHVFRQANFASMAIKHRLLISFVNNRFVSAINEDQDKREISNCKVNISGA